MYKKIKASIKPLIQDKDLYKKVKSELKKVLAQLEHTYEVPELPVDLKKAITPRDKEYIKFIDKLYEIIEQDPMTGLMHKQHFEKLEKEAGVFLYIDGDGIKQVNTKFGHAAGHAAIEALAEGIKKATRGKDTKTTRFGGDEFVIHIKDVSVTYGTTIGKRILDSINKQNIADFYKGDKNQAPEEVAEIKEGLSKMKLGASIGVGTTEKDADKALYKAKEKGRNRVEFITQLKVN